MAAPTPINKDQAKKMLAKQAAEVMQANNVMGEALMSLINRARETLLKNMILLDADGNPIMSARGLPSVSQSKLDEFMQFTQGIGKAQMALDIQREMSTKIHGLPVDPTVAEAQQAIDEMVAADKAARQVYSEAMQIFQSAILGGPLTEAQIQDINNKVKAVVEKNVQVVMDALSEQTKASVQAQIESAASASGAGPA